MAQPRKATPLYSAPPAEIADVYQTLFGEELTEHSIGYCPNPNHGGNGVRDVSPNSCSYDREKGVYHCRACDEGGNVYRLIRDQGGIEKGQEQAWLVERGLASGNDWANPTARYTYRDAAGEAVYEVARWTPSASRSALRTRR